MTDDSIKKETEALLSKLFTVADLVDYQNGSIVSKTLIDKSTGTVTLFAFDRGQGLSEHTAPFDAMVQIVDGEAEIRIAEDTLIAHAGDMVIMPANVPHALKAVEKFKMTLVMIRG